MGQRTVRRVPLDFEWPTGTIWPGFDLQEPDGYDEDNCPVCEEMTEGWDPDKLCAWHKLIWKQGFALPPPTGDGWQLWETTSEGSPVSPVFATAEELAAWCETGATAFAGFRLTRDQWLRSFIEDTTDIATTMMFRVP